MSPRPWSLTDEEVLTWVEQVAVFVAFQYGVKIITGRVLGWLMICDPPHQSVGQIARAIGASRTAVASSLRFLTAAGFVRQDPRSGERVVRYGMDNDAWTTVMRRRLAALVSFREIAQDGIQMIGPADPRSERMRAARDIFDWLDAVVSDAERLNPPTSRRESDTEGASRG
ncbi:MAG TPA: helix-turn-helix domain-containing protein [Streptosporangiaceae bacterium]|nr:helix-turn-helix domain-containing protein [Streptosporangiaceae bacterium]